MGFKKKILESVFMTLLIYYFSKLVFNDTINHCLILTALILIFACADSQRGGYKQNNNVDNNLCVMIKKNARSEIPLYE